MERLRKTFTCLFLFSALSGVALIMVSCNQQTNKQQPASTTATQADKNNANPAQQNMTPSPVTAGQENQNPNVAGSPQNVSQGKKLDHPVVLNRDYKKDPNSKNEKMLNAFARNSVENLGPISKTASNPDQVKAREFFLSGQKKSTDGDQEGAIADFTQSLNLYKMPVAYLKRGFAELVLQDYTSALNDMNESIKMNPAFDKAYFGRGVCKFEQQDFQGAEEDMKKYVEKDKTTAMAYNYLAGCRFMQKDYKGALENYELVAKLDPKYPDVYTNRGMMKHYLNDLKGAVEDYNKALAADPDNSTAYNNRGGAKLNQGDAKGALADFNKAISLKKDYADAYDNRGKAKITLGDKAGACEDWQKASSLGLETSKDLIEKYCK
jgi:tetratricopeptide (TPR) repeat protein